MTSTPDSTVKLLIHLIGEAAAFRMMDVKHFGGGNFDVPKSETGLGAQTFAALADVVGMDNAKRLSQHFGGESLYIPNLSAQYRQERNKSIVSKYNAGMSIRELMREYGLTDRRIWEILKTTDMQQTTPLSRFIQESLF